MPSLLVPVSVAAKIIKAKTAVPSPGGAPFNTDLSLEPGIHVHWALPDALARARHIGENSDQKKAPQQVIFPGIPDLWLVTRFNPPVAGAPRTWKAWVVDSRAKSVTPLEKWSAPAAPDPNSVHTLPGVLPAASGHAGWGVFDGGNASFNDAILSCIYYPTGRGRFGFYDDLSGLASSGTISYTVVGWYSSTAGDPLYNSANRTKQIDDWGLSYDHHWSIADLLTAISDKPVASSFKPQLTFTQPPVPQPLRSASAESALVMQESAARTAGMQKIQAALGRNSEVLRPIHTGIVPSGIVCHGSVMDIPLNAAPAAKAIGANQIAVYPSLKRALAAVTAPQVKDPQQLDYAEMLLQDLDHQKGTMGGVIDMPGTAHALSFQNIPGAPQYFAQIVISDAPPAMQALSQFNLLTATTDVTATGHWPTMFARKMVSGASDTTGIDAGLSSSIAQMAPAPLFQAAPPAPTPQQIADWLAQVSAAFKTAAANAAVAGTPIDPKRVRVLDTRSKAKPVRLAPSVDGGGADSSSYWIRIDDTDALTQILTDSTGASTALPDAGNLYRQPGPRWYRPWSPQIVLSDAGRGYRFGEDGRYDSKKGTLVCRTSGYTTYGIYTNTGKLVQGSTAMANSAAITGVAGLPADTQSLLYEAVVLDTGSAPALASGLAAAERAAAQTYFGAAIQGIYLERLSKFSKTATQLSPAVIAALGTIKTAGTQPSEVAISPWQDPYDPLYLDTNYSLIRSSLETDWQLAEDQVEMAPATPGAINPPANQTEVFQERSHVTASITKILESALVTRQSLNPAGFMRLRQDAPNGLTQDVFQTMDVISTPLVAFDSTLFARGYRERTGVLRVNNLSLVDVFGTTRQWNGGNAAGPSVVLPPRLPYWSRLSFRLRSADQTQEANSSTPAVCGILLPDFLDHSAQVFDATGNSLGELRNGTDPAKPEVQFTPYPWVQGDPLATMNPILLQVVQGLTAQPRVDVPGAAIHESALTSMLRAIDTVRATLDPSYQTPDHKVSIMGEPILVMVARVEWQTNGESDPNKAPYGAALAKPPATPSISVRIGDITRPDDGVLGCFLPNGSAVNSRFAPVSQDAADHAILNGLTAGIPFNDANGLPVTHPFVLHQQNVVKVPADTPQDVILLSDIRGDLYATCGVLPRKSITVPKEFLDAALQNMEPVFGVGPVLTAAAGAGGIRPLFPPPQVQGYDVSYLTDASDPGSLMPPAPPIGELAPARVALKEGWVRLQARKM
jgi:hypothetical protein